MAEQRVIPMFSYEDVGRAADWIGGLLRGQLRPCVTGAFSTRATAG